MVSMRFSPSSKHCKMFPAYDKQSGTLLANVDEADMPPFPLPFPFPLDGSVPIPADVAVAVAVAAVDLVVNARGMTPRHSGMQALITPRRVQQGLWSRPPAAQRARIAKIEQRMVNKRCDVAMTQQLLDMLKSKPVAPF